MLVAFFITEMVILHKYVRLLFLSFVIIGRAEVVNSSKCSNITNYECISCRTDVQFALSLCIKTMINLRPVNRSYIKPTL